MKAVSIAAPAKVNLRLVVLGKDASGYHSLETLFCGISLSDMLWVESSAGGFRLEVAGGIEAGPPATNLVRRAADRFYDALGIEPDVSIRLEKRIPSAAGLGGGSSDAAATLRALNFLHGGAFDEDSLLAMGLALGSDVPFFLGPSPYALAWGRGERLLELPPLPERHVLVVNPDLGIPTADAFAHLTSLRAGSHSAPARPAPAVIDSSRFGTWAGVAGIARNDFESVALERIDDFAVWRDRLRDGGATIAMLSGSGSSLFGIFESEDRLLATERDFSELGVRTQRAVTLDRWPPPDLRH